MKLHRLLVSAAAGILLAIGQAGLAAAADTPMKKTLNEDQMAHKDCLGCHVNVTPGIVTQHLGSPHANTKIKQD